MSCLTVDDFVDVILRRAERDAARVNLLDANRIRCRLDARSIGRCAPQAQPRAEVAAHVDLVYGGVVMISDETPLEHLLKGRNLLKCVCGEAVFAHEIHLPDDGVVGQFLPCPKCGADEPKDIPVGSIVGGFTNNVMYFWGPPAE